MNKQILVCVILLATTVRADSLEEKKFWKDQMDYVNQSLDPANEACGTKFSFDWIDKAKLRAEADKHGHTPNGICTGIVDEVATICRAGDDEKAQVKAKIKGFRCGYANPRSLDLKSGMVSYKGNNDEANMSQWAHTWLMKKL